MHGVAVAHDVPFVGLLRLLVLLLEVDDVAGHEGVFLVEVVVFHQLLPADAELASEQAEGVSLAHDDVGQSVGQIDLMGVDEPGLLLHLLLPAAELPLAHALAVVFVEVVVLDEGDQAVGVGAVGGIAGLLQSLGPPLVVGDLQLEEEGIAPALLQELGVVFIGVLHLAVGAETLAARVVVVIDLASPPGVVALDAEVVVAAPGQGAVARPALQQSLGEGDAGRDAVFVHLLHGQGGVLLDVAAVGGVLALGKGRHRQQGQRQRQQRDAVGGMRHN